MQSGVGVKVFVGVDVGVFVGVWVWVGVGVSVWLEVGVEVGEKVGPNNWPGPQAESSERHMASKTVLKRLI